MKEIEGIILQAIKEADRNLFFIADHHAQSHNVVKKLVEAGYVILPRELTAKMKEKAMEEIKFGPQKPSDLVKAIYKAIIQAR